VAALAAAKRGPADGAHLRLTARQEQAIRRAITDTTPDQLKLRFTLWTRAGVEARRQPAPAWIEHQRFGIVE
jgi:hypothetical protein